MRRFRSYLVTANRGIVLSHTFRRLRHTIDIRNFQRTPFAFQQHRTVNQIIVTRTFTIRVIVRPTRHQRRPHRTAKQLPLKVRTHSRTTRTLSIRHNPTISILFTTPTRRFIRITTMNMGHIQQRLPLATRIFTMDIRLSFRSRHARQDRLLAHNDAQPVASTV